MMRSVFLLMTFLLGACNSVDKASLKILNEANVVHQEIVKKQSAFEADINNALVDVNAVSEQARELNDTTALLALKKELKQVKAIENIYAHWKDNLIEVPGFEAEHVHSEHCNHDNHGSELDGLSAAEHLKIQKELKKGLEEIVMQGNELFSKISSK